MQGSFQPTCLPNSDKFWIYIFMIFQSRSGCVVHISKIVLRDNVK